MGKQTPTPGPTLSVRLTGGGLVDATPDDVAKAVASYLMDNPLDLGAEVAKATAAYHSAIIRAIVGAALAKGIVNVMVCSIHDLAALHDAGPVIMAGHGTPRPSLN
jgi:hypothetical protein